MAGELAEKEIEEELIATEDEGQKRESLDDALNKVFEKHEEAEKPKAKPAIAKKQQESVEEATEAEAEQEPVEEEQGKPEIEAVAAPDGYDAALWSKIPAEAQQVIAEREQQVSELSTFKDAWQPIAEIAEPYKETLAFYGQSLDQGLRQLLQVNKFAQTADPAQYIDWYLQQRGSSLDELIAQREQDDQYTDPAQREVQQLRQQLQQFQSQYQTSSVQSEINAFKNDPAHPHFEAVKVQMGKLMQAGMASDLNDAYSQAVRLNPNLSQPDLAPEPAKVPQRKTLEKVKKMAGTSLEGSGSSKTTVKQSLDDKLNATFDKFGVN